MYRKETALTQYICHYSNIKQSSSTSWANIGNKYHKKTALSQLSGHYSIIKQTNYTSWET